MPSGPLFTIHLQPHVGLRYLPLPFNGRRSIFIIYYYYKVVPQVAEGNSRVHILHRYIVTFVVGYTNVWGL